MSNRSGWLACMKYRTWPRDDGTIDICDDDGPVYTNVEATLAERFIRSENQRHELMRALEHLKHSGLFDDLFRE